MSTFYSRTQLLKTYRQVLQPVLARGVLDLFFRACVGFGVDMVFATRMDRRNATTLATQASVYFPSR